MAITLTCPSCGQHSSVPDQYAGQTVKCPHCEGLIVAPAGVLPRTRTAASYFNRVRQEPEPERFACGVCQGLFGVEEVYDREGAIICHACFAAEQARAQAAENEARIAARAASAAQMKAMAPTSIAPWDEEPEPQAGLEELAGSGPAETREAAPSSPSVALRMKRKQAPAYLPYAIAGGVAAMVIGGFTAMHWHKAPTQLAADQSAQPPGDSSSTAPPISSVPNPTAPSPTVPSPAPGVPLVSRWETENAPRIAALRTEAHQLEQGGDLAGASAKYQELFDLAHSAGASDQSAALKKDLASAQGWWDAAKKKMDEPAPSPAVKPEADVAKPPAPTAPSSPAAPALTGKEWEAANKADIEQMLAQVEQVKGLDKVAALLKYKQIFDLVGDHLKDVADPDLKRRLAGAVEVRKQMTAAMRDSDESRAATISSLLDSGIGALERGKWKTGLETLADARHIIEAHIKPIDRLKNADYLTTLNGIAVAYLNTKETQKAGDLYEDSTPLGKAALGDPPRDILWNRAVLDMRQKFKVLRAVKGLREYMEKHKLQSDEEMLNLLGTGLSIANQNAPADPRFLNECAEFYVLHNSELERMRPGLHRWGVTWILPQEAEVHAEEQRKAQALINAAVQRSNAALAVYKKAQEDARPKGRTLTRSASEAQVEQARQVYEATKKEIAQAKAQYPQQPWLTDIQPVIPPRPMAIASASPTPSEAQIPAADPAPARVPTAGPDATPGPEPSPAPQPVAPPVRPEPVSPPPVISHRAARYALAFPVDRNRLVTASEVLGNASTVRMEDGQGNVIDAKVIAKGDRLALLEVDASAAPGGFRYLNVARDFTGGAVRCAAFPEASVFGPEIVMLKGDNVPAPAAGGNWMVGLSDHPRLPGSPLLNASNEIVGVVLAKRDDPRSRLPAISFHEVAQFLADNHALPAAPCGSPDPTGVFQVSAEGE
jgi:hypothetical protein